MRRDRDQLLADALHLGSSEVVLVALDIRQHNTAGTSRHGAS